MEHLEEVTIDELQDTLENVDGKNPTKRIFAAIAYKNGVTQTELAEWYDVERKTIYNWLSRFESNSLVDAVTDGKRTGRKRKLTDNQQLKFEDALHVSPGNYGFDAPAWTPALAQRFLEEEFDVDYSIPSCRRLMKEAGLSYQKCRRTAAERDTREEEEIDDEIIKSERRWMPR